MDDTSGIPVENNENSGTEIAMPENFVLIFKGAKAILLKQPITSIGRSHDNTIVIDDPRISRHHLEIRFILDHFVAFDLQSTGGTYINGKRVNQGLLYAGDLISLAGIDLVFTQNRNLPESNKTDTSPIGPGERSTADFHPSMTDKNIK